MTFYVGLSHPERGSPEEDDGQWHVWASQADVGTAESARPPALCGHTPGWATVYGFGRDGYAPNDWDTLAEFLKDGRTCASCRDEVIAMTRMRLSPRWRGGR